jgi:putative hemolysin
MNLGLPAWLVPLLDRILGLKALAAGYAAIPEDCTGDRFLTRVLDQLEIRYQLRAGDLERVPRSGPLVVVANHPYGGIEGIVLASVLRQVRPDVKIIANYLLGRIPELAELFFLVDPFDSPGAPRRNVVALRRIIHWVRDGGVLAVFPAGEVAHLNLRRRRVDDPPWDPTIGRIIRRAQCPVIPVHFSGRNGTLFQVLGLIHPLLRTVRLPRELLNRRGRTINLRIGTPITARSLGEWPTDEELISYLRRRTEVLAESASATPERQQAPAAEVMPVAVPLPVSELEREVAALPPEQCLVDGPRQKVLIAEAEQIPQLLQEIGRLRELTFRAVGEGTGQEIDLDRFDPTYLHLFIWNLDPPEVVGAYRVGQTDRLLADGRLDRLYTATLFHFQPELFEAVGPALEMGRSFIRVEHQRSFSGLMLLWKGIGEYVLRNPHYTTLFGPVSISADYSSVSQQLVVAFLKQNTYRHEWTQWVRPRLPFRPRHRRNYLPNPADLRSFDEVSHFVSEIEADGKGAPILLKQYLKLGGRLLGFNIDPDFSNVLDVLIMVDLRQTAPAILARYMGRQGAETFLARHTRPADN